MSTPRHQDYCQFCKGDAEGVAAPLEPSPLQFVDEFTKGCEGLTEVDKVLMAEIAQRWAAAVSKNLQQSFEQLCGDLKAIQQDYTNEKKRADGLEKEIAALRETKL